MSTSKKISSKSSKSPAAATKSAVTKPVAPKKSKVAASPSVKAASAPASVRPATAVKPVASKLVQTTINARVDVGFGNLLFIRGEGPGLSWDRGISMDCIEADLWRIVLPESARGHTFKFLVNDLTWSTGSDFTATSGSSATHTPEF
jgi:hypothetical protein